MQDKARVHLIVTGKVQGVFFRAETQRAASRFGVSGWVRNRADGSVEAVAEGGRDDVEKLVQWCHTGSPGARVARVDATWEDYQAAFDEFAVRY